MTGPALLMLHGHGGDRHEAALASGEAMFDRAASQFEARGVACLRPDLRGLKIGPQISEAQALLDGMQGVPRAVLGFSQGGLVALHLSGADLIALWNPVLRPATAFPLYYDTPRPDPEPGFWRDAAPRDGWARIAAQAAPVLLAQTVDDRLAPDAAKRLALLGGVALDGGHIPDAASIDRAASALAEALFRLSR